MFWLFPSVIWLKWEIRFFRFSWQFFFSLVIRSFLFRSERDGRLTRYLIDNIPWFGRKWYQIRHLETVKSHWMIETMTIHSLKPAIISRPWELSYVKWKIWHRRRNQRRAAIKRLIIIIVILPFSLVWMPHNPLSTFRCLQRNEIAICTF